MGIYNAAWAIPFLPLLGALGSLGVETQRRAAQLCVTFSGLSFVVAALVLGVRLTHATGAPFDSLLTFFAMTPPEGATFATQFQAQVGVHVDALSASFAAAIAFATLVIQAYAVNAMRGEPGYRRFFCASSVLAFCTTGFVLSPNLFDSLIMWVGASASLYVLFTLSWQRAEPARRAMRAMVVVTAGDVALTLGVVFTWIKFGVFSSLLAPPSGQTLADPFSFDVISQGVIATLHKAVAGAGPRAILVMGIVFIVAASVRSVQFPFTLWLTDAASSAVPVLALASATVAPLGIFLVARIYPVVAHAPRVLPVLALVGGVSAALTAATGIAQRSITRIAACAVAAELGLGLVALGMGGYGAGVFIAFTAVLTSTLLLLAVANLVRVYRTDDITEMGGAWAKLRTTSVALGVWAVLAGGIGLSAYYALSSALIGADPAGGTFSGSERVVVVIVTMFAAALVALLAGRLLLSVTTGAVTRRRGFQHDRVAEVEQGLRRPLWLAVAGAVVAVVVGLPGLEPFDLGSGRVAAPTFMRFVFYGSHHQSLGLDGIAVLIALLVLACGFGAAYLWFNPARRVVVIARGSWPLRVAAEGFYVERLTELAAQPMLAIAGRVSSFDDQVTAPIAASVGESADEAAAVLGAYRSARFARYLAGSIVVVAILTLLSVLAATGHLWVHLA
ncbi:MAG: proton-conducting transporter transmembrane domain-containing protein [Candidatus Dormibacteria bacterium]